MLLNQELDATAANSIKRSNGESPEVAPRIVFKNVPAKKPSNDKKQSLKVVPTPKAELYLKETKFWGFQKSTLLKDKKGKKKQKKSKANKVVVRILKATRVPKADRGPNKSCDPYVRAWLEDKKGNSIDGTGNREKRETPERHFQWPPKQNTLSPVWNSVRDLGKPKSAKTDMVHFEMWDADKMTKDDFLGEADVPLSVFSMLTDPKQSFTVYLRHPRKERTKILLEVQRLDSELAKPKEKILFLVRHGESAWNAAQESKNVVAMYKTADHPLNEDGVDQALDLAAKLERGAKNPNALSSEMERTMIQSSSLVVSSPLTRAIETALLACYSVILTKTNHLFLLANAREKRNFGGKDSSGKAVGDKVPERAYTEIAKVLAKQGKPAEEAKKYRNVGMYTYEVDDKWWRRSAEAKSEIKARLDELFLYQLRYTSPESVVVVGHSHYMRALFQEYLSEETKNSSNETAASFYAELCKKKLMNCGVAAVKVKYMDDNKAVIDSVELLFGTELV